MQFSQSAKTWVTGTAGIVGIALTAITAFISISTEGGKWKEIPWSHDAVARMCLFCPIELAFSSILLLIGASVLAKLTGDAFGNRWAALVAWLGVYYFSIGSAAAVGSFLFWPVGILVFLILAGALVRWAFDASAFGCVLAIGMLALVRGIALVGDILVTRVAMPIS